MNVKCPYCGVEKEVARDSVVGKVPKVTQCASVNCNKLFGVAIEVTYTTVLYKIEEVGE